MSSRFLLIPLKDDDVASKKLASRSRNFSEFFARLFSAFLNNGSQKSLSRKAIFDKPRLVGRPAGRPAADVRPDGRRRRPCHQRRRKKNIWSRRPRLAASIKCCGRPFRGRVWGGLAPPAKNREVCGAAPPSQTRKFFEMYLQIFNRGFIISLIS